MGLHQAKKLHSKGSHQYNENTTEWKKIAANHISDKGLIMQNL